MTENHNPEEAAQSGQGFQVARMQQPGRNAMLDRRPAHVQDFEMWAVEQGYSIPMFLGLTTIVCKTSLSFTPQRTGILNPYTWSVPTP